MTDEGAEVVAAQPHGFRHLLAADVWRCTGQTGWRALLRAWLSDPAFRPVFTMRLCQACAGAPVPLRGLLLAWARWWHQRARLRCAVDIPWSLQAGPGLKLLHGVGIVINADTAIGANVTIMQGVTIGGTQRGIPIIEDDVIVCANATVLGNVRLGQGAVVGAGAVVLKDVPANCNVAGNPARLLVRTAPPKGYHPLPPGWR